MSEPQTPLPAKLIASIIYRVGQDRENNIVHHVLDVLMRDFGPLDFRSMELSFDRTTYYNREMGDFLQRLFVSFQNLVGRERLADIKLITNAVEHRLRDPQGNRRVNIDPGLLSLENLVMATGKNFTHRIYLGKGIFAEVTLIYQNRKFIVLPWTYPDYAAEETIAILNRIRHQLGVDLKTKNLS
jgi:hypothetical protein